MEEQEARSAMQRSFDDPEQLFILSTLAADGYPDARLMGNICAKTLRCVYFTCRAGTRKIGEIGRDPRACVTFASGSGTFWLYGDAGTTTAPEVRRQIWDERMRSIYPQGPDSPNLTVVRFIPKRARVLEAPGSDYLEFDL